MPLKERLIQIANAVLPKGAQIAFRESAGTTIDADEDQWRRLSDTPLRDLSPMTQYRMQRTAVYLWEQNLLGNRLIELPLAYLLAEGVHLRVEDEDNQKLLDAFWNDPINDMDIKLAKKVRELALFGEQCYPAFVNEANGAVRIGYLDPQLIQTVVMDPDNPEQPIGVVTTKNKAGRARRFKVIINGPEDVFTERTQGIRDTFTDGESFYFRINDLSSGTRGRSDLLSQADWLDGYDQFLFGEMDRQKFLRAFLWDVTLKNADAATVKTRASEITAPSPGSVRVHNDSEVWSAETPSLNGADTSNAARLLRNHVLGGATMPETWFGGGGDVNRATAAEMNEPTFKIYAMRQTTLKHMLQSIGRYVLMKAQKTDKTIDWADAAFKVQAVFPELTIKDTSKYAAALQQVVVACATAITGKLIARAFAVQLIAAVAARLGVDADPEQMLEDATAEAAANAESDVFTTPADAAGDTPGVEDTMAEAVELIAGWQREGERIIAEYREATHASGRPATDDGVAKILAAGFERQAESNARLIEALAKTAAGQKIELTLNHGKTTKTVQLPDGRAFSLTERDAG